MVAGSVGYFLVVAGTASQSAVLTLCGGACVGIGAGLLWSGQGRMATDLSNNGNRGCRRHCATTAPLHRYSNSDNTHGAHPGRSGRGQQGNSCSPIGVRRRLVFGVFDALMMGGSGLVGNALTINFAPVREGSSADSGSGGMLLGASAAAGEYDPAAVRKYFTILCLPVGLAIVVLCNLPNLPKPVSGPQHLPEA